MKTEKIKIELKVLIVIFILVGLVVIFVNTCKPKPVAIEQTQLKPNERLCEILDENRETVMYFVGHINYVETETYVQIKKINDNGNTDTVIILPSGMIRFFNVPQEVVEK